MKMGNSIVSNYGSIVWTSQRIPINTLCIAKRHLNLSSRCHFLSKSPASSLELRLQAPITSSKKSILG